MKNTALVLITLIVGSLASPTLPVIFSKGKVQDLSNERIVTGQIIEAIEAIAQQIRDAGLDPYNLDAVVSYELPVPVIFSVNAIVDNLLFTGLSNIVVQSMNFSLLQSRLTFNIVLPSIGLSVANSEAKAVFFGDEYTGSFSGSLNINQIRMVGDIRINVGIISGISIRSLSLQFSLGGIQSHLNLNIFGNDLSARINTWLGTTIPSTLAAFSDEVNELIEAIAWIVINEALDSSSLFY